MVVRVSPQEQEDSDAFEIYNVWWLELVHNDEKFV